MTALGGSLLSVCFALVRALFAPALTKDLITGGLLFPNAGWFVPTFRDFLVTLMLGVLVSLVAGAAVFVGAGARDPRSGK